MLPNQNFGNFQTNSLPYPADSLVRNPVSVNVNNPPFIPNVECTPEFQQYLPVIAGSTIEAIVQSAQQNNLRAFTFNQLSENNYANQEFASLVSTVVNLMMYAVYVQRNTMDFGGLLHTAVQKGLELFIATNVARYQQLAQYLDQNGVAQIQSLLGELQQLGNAINQMKYQMQTQGNTRPSFSGAGFGQAPTMNQNFNQNFGQGAHQAGFGSPHTGPSGVFQTGNPNSPVMNTPLHPGQNADPRFANRYGTRSEQVATKPVEKSEPKTMNPTTPSASIPIIPVNDAPTEKSWKASPTQPYPPIYKRSKKKLMLENDEQGETRILIRNKTDEEMFDYETHTALTSLGVSPAARLKPTQEEITIRNETIEQTIRNGEQKLDPLSVDIEDNLNSNIIVYPNYGLESSLESAVLEHELTRQAQLILNEESRIKVFKTTSFLIRNLGVLSESEREEVQHLQDSRTFEELLVKMKGSAASLPRKAWNLIERKITSTINDVLRLQLSLELSMDSFLMDFESLNEVLKNKSSVIYEAFTKHQRSIIKYAIDFVASESELKGLIKENMLDIEKGDRKNVINFDFLKDELTITSLDINADELDIDLYQNLGCMILSSESRTLSALADKLYENRPNPNPVGRDYVLLNDGVLLRISKGLVGVEFYTASVVNFRL